MAQSLRLYIRLLGYLKPYLLQFTMALLAMSCLAALEPLLPALLKPLIDGGFWGGQATDFLVQPQWIPALIVSVFLLKAIFEYAGNVLSQWVANSAVRDIRTQIFSAQIRMPLAATGRGDAGDFISRISYDASQISVAITSAFLVIVKDSLIILGLSAYLLTLSWRLTLTVAVVLPVIGVLIYAAGRQFRTSNRQLQHLMARMTAQLRSVYGGLRDIKLYQIEDKASTDFHRTATAIVSETMRAVRVQALNLPLVQVFAALGVSAVIWAALSLKDHQQVTPGFFVSYIAALAMIFEPIRRISATNLVIQRGLAAAEGIFAVLDRQQEKPGSNASGAFVCSDSQGSQSVLSLEECATSWSDPDGRETFSLGPISIRIEPGEFVAVVGPSGAGKSTLLSAMLGLVPLANGQIKWDDDDLSRSPQQLRDLFSVVSQTPYLFTGSIRENLDPEDRSSDAEIYQLLELVDLANVVESLGGLDFVLEDDASQLSGGQRQRIAIARALLRPSPIVVFDEATNAIEERLESTVIHGIRSIYPGRSLVVITHRLASLNIFDTVIALKEGMVVAAGSPEMVVPNADVQSLKTLP